MCVLAGREFVSLAEREDALLRDLFQGYQRWVRPVLHANHTVKVRFGLKISQLVDVVRQTYRSSYFASLTLNFFSCSLSMVLKYSSWSSPWFWTPLTYEANTSLYIRHILGASASLESIYRKYCLAAAPLRHRFPPHSPGFILPCSFSERFLLFRRLIWWEAELLTVQRSFQVFNSVLHANPSVYRFPLWLNYTH